MKIISKPAKAGWGWPFFRKLINENKEVAKAASMGWFACAEFAVLLKDDEFKEQAKRKKAIPIWVPKTIGGIVFRAERTDHGTMLLSGNRCRAEVDSRAFATVTRRFPNSIWRFDTRGRSVVVLEPSGLFRGKLLGLLATTTFNKQDVELNLVDKSGGAFYK